MNRILLICLFSFFTILSCNFFNDEGGTVEVNLTYPSEYLPEMDIYLLNIETKEIISKRSIENISPVTFKNVPTGTYVVYAITVDKLMAPEAGLGEQDFNAPESEYVSASGGFTNDPNTWDLTQFNVERNKISVEINDWDVSIPNR